MSFVPHRREFVAEDRVAVLTWSRVSTSGLEPTVGAGRKGTVIRTGSVRNLSGSDVDLLKQRRGSEIVANMIDDASGGCVYARRGSATSVVLGVPVMADGIDDPDPLAKATAKRRSSIATHVSVVSPRAEFLAAQRSSGDRRSHMQQRSVSFEELSPKNSEVTLDSPDSGALRQRRASALRASKVIPLSELDSGHDVDDGPVAEEEDGKKKSSVSSSSQSKSSLVMLHRAIEEDAKRTEGSLLLLHRVLMVVSLSVIIITAVVFNLDQQTVNYSVTADAIQTRQGDQPVLMTVRRGVAKRVLAEAGGGGAVTTRQ